ncbi:DUF4258 domain-containing protein [uncultured Oscillibacter sp.]|uniref:DUF4258 domain-containing protein n=1 Tax=uncultured Oscillibacter sp. TaxID=876091 RepID=UPI0025E65AA6|nr:DUF4258 domain-containing protein [uncultured Oscillibacter sp.]
MDIQKVQSLFQKRSVKWSTHCLERMQERDISRADVLSCVLQGEIIEDYPNDYPFPSCLIFGYTTKGKVLHTVIGVDGVTAYVITAYYPSIEKFEADLKTRKER